MLRRLIFLQVVHPIQVIDHAEPLILLEIHKVAASLLFQFAACLHIDCFFIKKELLYSNVKDSIVILPWIHPTADHNDFSK